LLLMGEWTGISSDAAVVMKQRPSVRLTALSGRPLGYGQD
jgi:hypothetical protein